MNETVRVMIVHHQPLVAAGIEALLSHIPHWQIVGSSTHTADAITMLRYRPINVVITEQHLSGLSGLALCGIIRRHFPHISTAIIGYLSPLQQIIALAHGVGCFIHPDINKRELSQLANLLRNHSFTQHTLLHSPTELSHLHDLARHTTFAPGHAPNARILSQREHDVARLVARGYTNKHIAYTLGISAHTVKQHLSSVMRKCHIHKRKDLAQFIKKIGWA